MKYLNAISSGTSLLASMVTGKACISGMPPAVSFELTNHCNLHCPECPSGAGTMSRKRGFMNTGFYRRIIAGLKPFLLNTNLYFQGEPMLHPEFFSFIEEAAGIETVVSTNGHYLNEENAEKLSKSGLSRIIISVDGISQEIYSIYRKNGDVEKVKEGIRTLCRAVKENKSSLRIYIQMLVNRYNENQLNEIQYFAEVNGAFFVTKSMQIYDDSRYADWMPYDDRFRRYGAAGEKTGIKSFLPRRCTRIWFNPVVTWDGKVLPCCFDKDGEYVMGDLNTETFREIWHGTRFREFRQRLLSGREKIDICRNCTSGLTGVRT